MTEKICSYCSKLFEDQNDYNFQKHQNACSKKIKKPANNIMSIKSFMVN